MSGEENYIHLCERFSSIHCFPVCSRLCVYYVTAGFPYFGGPLVSVWSPCMPKLLFESKHRHRLEQHGDLHRR